MKYNVAFQQLLPAYPSRQYCFSYIILWWVKTGNLAIKVSVLFVSLLFLFLKKNSVQ